MNWFKYSVRKITEGFLQNVGVVIFVFLSSGGYIYAVSKITKFREWAKNLPSDVLLTALFFVLVGLIILVINNHKQKQELLKLKKHHAIDEEKSARFATHGGVWWKIYPDSEYIEDFPYCTCCEPRKKLTQIEWHPDEIFQCPITKAQFKLFLDETPIGRADLVRSIYTAYFDRVNKHIEELFYAELKRLKELTPKITNNELFDQLFQIIPLSYIPKEELDKIRIRYPNPQAAFYFINRHFRRYKKYFKKNI